MNNQQNDIIDNIDKQPEEISHVREMMLWWERKRIIYNVCIVSVAVFCIYSFWEYPLLFLNGKSGLLRDSLFLFIGANICYTLGWGVGAILNYFTGYKGLLNVSRWIFFVIGTLFSMWFTLVCYVFASDALFY